MPIGRKNAPDHNALYRTAEQQSGYFTTRQALEAGFSSPLLAHHVHQGQFLRVRQGVYRLARFPETPQADLFVALLELGPQAAISHESALALYDLSDVLPGAIHVTVPRTSSRRHSGLHLHTSHLDPDEVTQRAGLRVTTVVRTLADLIAGHRQEEQIREAIQEALQRGLVTREALIEYATRRGGRIEHMIREALERELVR
jgi:predicted transcriptional regulator of viral defense system